MNDQIKDAIKALIEQAASSNADAGEHLKLSQAALNWAHTGNVLAAYQKQAE